MKYLDGGFAYKRLNLHPEEATTSVMPYAIVGPEGNVLLVELSNRQKTAATYRTKESAQQALGNAQGDFPGARIWDRRNP